MILTIHVKDEGVLTLLRDMERLDLLHVTPRNTVFPAPASSDAEYLKRKAREAHDIELINRDAEWLNSEALDVLSYAGLLSIKADLMSVPPLISAVYKSASSLCFSASLSLSKLTKS
jgi:hypothetical protein